MLQLGESVKAREQRVAGCEAGGGADVSRAELQANRHGSFWRHLQPAAGRAQQRHSYNLKWQPCRTPSCQHHHLTQHTLSEKANFTSSQCVCVTMCVCFFFIVVFIMVQLTVHKVSKSKTQWQKWRHSTWTIFNHVNRTNRNTHLLVIGGVSCLR